MPTDLNLDFSSTISGTLLDKDGQGTGFTSVQANTANNAYDLGRIYLNPSASTLVLTGTQGSFGGSNNTLKNGLQVPITSTEPFTISTRIKGPFTSLTTSYQQGGIFIGPDQDNYVKLAVINTGIDGLGLQFYQEQNGVPSTVGGSSEIRDLNWSSIDTLDLFLKGDPVTGAIAAAYRVNSDTVMPTSFSQQFTPQTSATFFAPETTARTGILAFTLDAADATVTFDSFGIQYTQPATGAGIQVSTPDAGIVQNRMVFSTVNEEVRASKRLTLSNTGTEPLTITGLTFGDSQENNILVRTEDRQRAGDFNLVNGPTLPITLAANSSINLDVVFAPQRVATANNSVTPTTDTTNGESYASLTIISNDPTQPIKSVNLAGLNAADYEGKNEPSIAEIARIFGWTLDVGTEKQNLGGNKTPVGDEVYSPYWLPADPSLPVELWPIAQYTGRSNRPHGSVRFEAKPGSGGNSGFLYNFAGKNDDDNLLGSNDSSGGENQKLLPKILVNNVNSVPTASTVDFIPTTAFALNAAPGTWTDDSQNGTGELHNWRMFPVRDANGTLIPNTWYATEDYGNSERSYKNYDYQDNVYLLVNAKPETAALDPTVPGLLPGATGLVFDFNQTYAGSLQDKDGQTIGFTSTQLNKKDTFTSKASYSPMLLDIDTDGTGTLSLTTTTGSNGKADNALVNGLLTAFDGRAGKFMISTELGPLSNITVGYQQGGVMFGPNQDNFIKLVAIAQPGGTLGIQFYSERKGVGTTIGPIIPVASPSTLQSLELSLLTDPQTGSVQAAYRAIYPNSDPGMVILPGSSVTLTGDQLGHYFAAQSKAGIITTSKNATPINITFDSFAITPG